MTRNRVRFFPEENNPTLRRVGLGAFVLLPVIVAAASPWGPASAASAFAGALLMLLCGLWTHAAVKGQLFISPKRMRRKLWWRIAWRFILLGVALYAILQAPWLRLEPLIAGLSLFFPAILVNLIIELVAGKTDEGRKRIPAP